MPYSNARFRWPIQPGETLPPWLARVEQQLDEMPRKGQPYKTAAPRIELLRNVLAQIQDDPACTPEIRATLQHDLAIAYQEHLGTDSTRQMETALQACEDALQVFTVERYPYQYASVQITLGATYRERAVGAQRDNLERAIACYHQALAVFTRADYPDEYATVQHGLGQTMQLRIEGARLENVEQAIASCREALDVRTAEAFPFLYAQTLLVLGAAYFRRVAGERRDNLEWVIDCCRQATAIFTMEDFPVEYAQGQNYLAIAHAERINGEKRDNLEQAISYYRQALRVYTIETFPIEYAKVQNNLGIAYSRRIAGERRDNLEQALACYREVLRIWTVDTFPYQYATLQLNLGGVYVFRVAGERRGNLERAITCYREVLRIWTLAAFPYQYAKVQNNLGEAYQHRLAGERSDNLERAIACYRETLRIWTLNELPQDYAMVQRNLGAAYQLREIGQRRENLDLALAAHQEALRVYTLHAFPVEHRQLQLDCAETQVLRQDWVAAHDAYVSARKAEDLLVALGAGAVGRDAILKEGRDAAVRDGFVLAHLGNVEEAAVTIERGRARGLAEAMQFNAADPRRIRNTQRQARYITAQQAFIAAQATLQAVILGTVSGGDGMPLDDDSQRQIMLERSATYREMKADFNAVIEEIQSAQDPADFFSDNLEGATILEAVQQCGQRHALVYLAATPWGGAAIAAFSARRAQDGQNPSRFAALALPALTDDFLGALIETRSGDDANHITGGFDCAQRGNAFELLQAWPGTTMLEKAAALHAACPAGQQRASTLDAAAHHVFSIPQLAPLLDVPISNLSEGKRSLLMNTLNHAVLQRELQRCQPLLSKAVVQPLIPWLHEAGISSLTLVPCGPLAAFPLQATLLNNGLTLGETFPTSIAPSARSLLRDESTIAPRTGMYTLGNPYPTRQELPWGEAEAFTLAELGSRLGHPTGVKVQWQATRDWLLEVLQKGYVVDASCHGVFDTHDFLRSRLLLAHDEDLTLADMLSYQANLRGLRLLILSACQTAILDLQGARDEVRSLAAGMLQAGAAAVLAALWAVDDRATYLLMARFALEWFPQMNDEPPTAALARTQHWLRTVTNRELELWQATALPTSLAAGERAAAFAMPGDEPLSLQTGQLVAVRGRAHRFDAAQAQEIVQSGAEEEHPDACPYADPYYWAGFQITGW